jgi:hypothetical protein
VGCEAGSWRRALSYRKRVGSDRRGACGDCKRKGVGRGVWVDRKRTRVEYEA